MILVGAGAATAMAGTLAPVKLGKAGHFAILSEAGVTDVPSSQITGWVGASPITGAANHLTCAEVKGRVYSVDAAGPAPCSIIAAGMLTTAISAMTKGYTDAAGRLPDVVELGAGNIGGLTLAPGVYKWSTGVTIPSNVTLKGTAKDVWIFQIAQGLDIAGGMSVVLKGGAKENNVFWQVAGGVTMETGSHFQGVVLSATQIAMNTGATIHGRLLSQTAVSLQMNVVKALRQ